MEFKYPEYNGNSIYNLACKISESLGVEQEGKSIDLNFEKKKTILILMDGFGINYVKKLNIKNDYKKITTVFPSTTSTVLTTLFTAKTPGEHGIIGYTNYTNEIGIVNTMRYTFSGYDVNDALSSLKNFNDIYSVKSYLKESKKKSISILFGRLNKSVFTNSTMGGEYMTYKYIWDSLYQLDKCVSMDYDFIYLYIPTVDSLAHAYGTYENSVMEAAEYIFNYVINKVEKYKDKYNILLTADHGHFPVSENIIMNERKDILKSLDIMPYGDSRALFLRTRNDIDDLLHFNDTDVFKKDEILKSGMLGNVNEKYIGRIGDYLLVPHDGKCYIYQSKINDDYHLLKSHHGGLTEDEQYIPLFYM